MKSRNPISRRQFVSGMLSTAAIACLPKRASAALVTPVAEALQARQRPRFGAYRIPILSEPFPMEQVRLLDSPFLTALKTNQEFLHSLPEDRLVHNFRVNAGITSTAEPLGGWEDPTCELRGHYTGHFLSSCGLMYASTGDDQIKAKGDAIVADLAQCQKKFPNGYLSAFPETFFDRLRDGLGVWAPFYTIHKIMAGMLDMYTYCHNEQALEVAQGMARWAGHWVSALSDGEMERILQTEFGGMNESLINLAAITGNGGYFFTATRFEKMWFLKPLAGHRDELKGLHVNTHIPQVIGAARRFEVTNDPFYQNVASYFWDEVTSERSYATGGTSDGERWLSDAGDMSKDLSLWSEECCCGYNMLKLTRHLHQWTADPRYMDYYERTLYNSRLGTQHPDNGYKMYYLPLATGYWKFFNSHFNSFWCCTGTGSEEFSKFNDTIYFRHGDEAFVNLFIPSEANWKEKGLTLRQETHFPEQEGTTLIVKAEHPAVAAINIRIPYWVADGGSVSINGQPLSAFANPGSYLRLSRTWADGDKIEVKLPMKLHSQSLLGDPTQQATLYGPLVLAGRLGTDGLTEQMQYDVDKGTTQLSPPRAQPAGSMEADLQSPDEIRSAAWIEPVKGQPLTFQTVGQKSATTLIPFNSVFNERYGVYWKINLPRFRMG